MEEESLPNKKPFLSSMLSDCLESTHLSLTFLYMDRSPEDNMVRHCAKCKGTMKPNDPVTKIRKCGHLYHADCYVKLTKVRDMCDSSRKAANVRHALHQSTKTIRVTMSSKAGWRRSH